MTEKHRVGSGLEAIFGGALAFIPSSIILANRIWEMIRAHNYVPSLPDLALLGASALLAGVSAGVIWLGYEEAKNS